MPIIRVMRSGGPLDAAVRDGRNHGWDLAARSFLERPAGDSLLKSLRDDINRDYEAEFLLTAVRAQLLTSTELVETHEQLAAALIQQCANNEYVWFVSETERALLQRPALSWQDWAVRAMYRPAYELGDVVPPGRLDGIFHRHVAEHAEEMRIKDAIPTFRQVGDPTSMEVRRMYEEFPYPRWVWLVRHTHEERARWIREFFGLALPWLDDEIRILMPGCGTGRKAIQMAIAFPKAKVLCTDLSRSSLAYMMRMARRHGVANIEPLQMDIYDLPAYDGTFDFIECSGVLHHLGDPVRGGRALVSRLRKGGILHFSMYSELARREVVRHRKQIGEARIPTMTADDIRAYRRQVMLEEPECIDRLPTPGDFFDTSRCKDLIMHPNEYRYTVKGIGEYLQCLDMPFMGFQRPPLNRHTYFTPYPREATDLAAWAAFEEANPDAFENLYDVWTIRT